MNEELSWTKKSKLAPNNINRLPILFLLNDLSLHIINFQKQTQEMERQRTAIDEYNKQYYEHKKNKDTYQSNRK